MVRCSVGIDYFPFFFGAAFLAAGFLAAAGLVAFFAVVFFAVPALADFDLAVVEIFFAAVFFTADAGFAGVFLLRDGRSVRASASGSIVFPIALASISTRSDQRM